MILEVGLESPLISLEVSSRVAAWSAAVCLATVDFDGEVNALPTCKRRRGASNRSDVIGCLLLRDNAMIVTCRDGSLMGGAVMLGGRSWAAGWSVKVETVFVLSPGCRYGF